MWPFRKKRLNFTFSRVDEHRARVQFEDGTSQVMTNAELRELLASKDVTLHGLHMVADGEDKVIQTLRAYMEQWDRDREEGRSLAGDHVHLTVLERGAEPKGDEWEASVKYDIVTDSGKVVQTETVRYRVAQEWGIQLLDIHMATVILRWSGANSTRQDEERLLLALGREAPEGATDEEISAMVRE